MSGRVPDEDTTIGSADADAPSFAVELRRAMPLLVAIPLLVAMWWGGGVLVTHSRIAVWDLRIERDLAAHRTRWLDVVTTSVTWLAESITVITATVVLVIVARRITGGWRVPLFVALAVGGEKLVYLGASLLVHRGRPPVPTLGTSSSTSSFPSGHVGSAVCLFGALALVARARTGRWATAAGLVGVGLVTMSIGFARMYDGFHFPSDVVAGAINGTTWLTFTWLVLRPLDVDLNLASDGPNHHVRPVTPGDVRHR